MKQQRFKRICPICGKGNLQFIPQHLEQVHTLSSIERKPYLAIAKFEGIKVYRNEPSIQKIKLVTRDKGVTKHRTSKSTGKKTLKPIKKRVNETWQQHPYPNFWFKHPFSLMIVGPTSCGKTYLVRQLLESTRMNDFYFEWYYNQHQKTYTDCERTVGPHRVKLQRGLPKYNEDDLRDLKSKKKTVIIFDDLMEEEKNRNWCPSCSRKAGIAMFR